jgi:UDP-N-acetylmuramoylalanine--D-glutamate ligase
MKSPVVWIAGGVDKGNDYSSLVGFAKEKVKALVILGPDTEKLSQVFSPIVPIVKETLSMKEAVEAAASLATKGDYVLLSPCCASFDLFQNYEDRGRQFKANIAQLDDN